jgi:DNA-binding TFAR19-related protein (PDSD5 family)
VNQLIKVIQMGQPKNAINDNNVNQLIKVIQMGQPKNAIKDKKIS